MRVRARRADSDVAPISVRPYLGQTLVTAEKEYEVHAVAVFEAIVLIQVVDDAGYPGWNPVWLFDVIDRTVPTDWICSMFHDDPSLVLGPEFVAGAQECYAAMVELEPEQVQRFWKRLEERRRDESRGT